MKLFGSKVYQIAATLVRIEALFLAGLAIYLAIRIATSKVEELDAILAEIIFLSFASVGLFFAGSGFIAKRNFARAPTVLANLIAIGVAYYMIDGERDLLGIGLGSFALVTLLAALSAMPHQGTAS
ncbi:MAG: hypothetical protein ABR62_00755 [Actinobacteria bacterium BACL2 MAG-120820-bin50]|jgi:hypothetical protein|uniref:Uncharacterized protein n=1 Tax=Actinobacteria bacterium BACL2 MAG-120820-bin50 TaxID=1655570 RepID=A0A0R2QHP4_9ACTN|nr:MAG: hypothetical protein ABR62_00755 [Actinobacteria bacterium BACL2 MAG-120820-bin50]KRP28712.1 MAG: hypothetical protein ABS31_04680 [Actinobacteria bacterium BACL2 MAG-120507-bin38]